MVKNIEQFMINILYMNWLTECLEMALHDVIIAKARINNVYQRSKKFVQHLIRENSATSSFPVVMSI